MNRPLDQLLAAAAPTTEPLRKMGTTMANKPDTDDPRRFRPTESSSIHSLASLVGAPLADTMWGVATVAGGLERPVTRIDDLLRVAEEVTRLGNLVGRVGGRSLRIQMITYRAMALREADDVR